MEQSSDHYIIIFSIEQSIRKHAKINTVNLTKHHFHAETTEYQNKTWLYIEHLPLTNNPT